MNIAAIYHRPESNYCFALDTKTVCLRIRFAKGEKLDCVNVLYNTKYDIAQKRFKQQLSHICDDEWYSYYGTVLNLHDERLMYVFEICHDGIEEYFCEYGLVSSYEFSLSYYDSFQYAYINPNDVIENVAWLNNAVFYQVFVDRFYKGCDNKDESYINAKWGELPTPKSFYGGDLDGIRLKLDYIQSLNVNALYLTPIFCSISNHKYDTYDYFNVDPMFGGNDALKRLVDACHQRGIRVVLDAVFNHISDRAKQFQDVLKKGNKSKYFNWFVIEGTQINKQRNNYKQFASCQYMPKLNTANPEVQQFLLDIATHWIKNYDIDGWRLDVSDEVSHDFWRAMRKAVRNAKADAVLIGENWHNSESYLQGDQFDSIMNYAFTKQMLDYFANDKLDENKLAQKLNGLLMRYTDTTNNMMFNLLDCHDTHRFYSQIGCDKNRWETAYALMIFMSGSCNLYYGDEILTEGGYDPDCRRTFDWDKLSSDADTKQFAQRIAQLSALKKQPALQQGSITIKAQEGVLTVERSCNSQTLKLFVSRQQAHTKSTNDKNVALISAKYYCIKGD